MAERTHSIRLVGRAEPRLGAPYARPPNSDRVIIFLPLWLISLSTFHFKIRSSKLTSNFSLLALRSDHSGLLSCLLLFFLFGELTDSRGSIRCHFFSSLLSSPLSPIYFSCLARVSRPLSFLARERRIRTSEPGQRLKRHGEVRW
jgi:hypothetical protein